VSKLKKNAVLLLIATLLPSLPALADNPRVWLDFEQGPVIIELDPASAPITTENFLDYVNTGFYDDLVIHRAVRNFVVQSGGFDRDLVYRSPTFNTIPSESDNGRSNERGTIAMALGGNVNTAQAQFYINTVHNEFLDEQFTVFGQVVYGMSLIDEFENLRTGPRFLDGRNFDSLPMSPPLIRRAVEIDGSGFPIMPQHAGSWFDAENAGVGFNIEIARNTLSDTGARVVLYWYDYRAGEPFWLLGVGEYDYGDSEVSLELVSWDGTGGPVDFLQPPPDDSYQVLGQLSLRFADCSSGEIDFELDELGSGSVTISRLSLPEGVHCEQF
jgi:peptidyl-prolyl cis-trans isomerase A (cyclophilin A)